MRCGDNECGGGVVCGVVVCGYVCMNSGLDMERNRKCCCVEWIEARGGDWVRGGILFHIQRVAAILLLLRFTVSGAAGFHSSSSIHREWYGTLRFFFFFSDSGLDFRSMERGFQGLVAKHLS
ncbi:hypothetical protein RIF29_11807 [Crotalaria pallida]|uniref:Uncharacterized protein n=1 Tax=Crotalaria pallida TaxID=3830 RepID=A0AAN9P1J6_CROPI